MTMGGNPDPDWSSHDEIPERECPFCGATIKRLPDHLRYEGCSET